MELNLTNFLTYYTEISFFRDYWNLVEKYINLNTIPGNKRKRSYTEGAEKSFWGIREREVTQRAQRRRRVTLRRTFTEIREREVTQRAQRRHRVAQRRTFF